MCLGHLDQMAVSDLLRSLDPGRNQVVDPVRYSVVELVLQEAQRHERVDIQQVSHGKVARMSSTCLLVRQGASGPAVRTGRPVTGSSMMRTFRKRALLGVSTIRPPSTSGWEARLASAVEPAPGRVPVVEPVVAEPWPPMPCPFCSFLFFSFYGIPNEC
jgi:hypothetical protein